jgi:chorismate mutase
MTVRGVRGATTVSEDRPEAMLSATRELLLAICEANPEMRPTDIASIFFTVTPDLRSVHPALAARELGWGDVPLLCAQEIPVPGSLPLTIRILIHWNTALTQKDIRHVYLRDAVQLRPDLVRSGAI